MSYPVRSLNWRDVRSGVCLMCGAMRVADGFEVSQREGEHGNEDSLSQSAAALHIPG